MQYFCYYASPFGRMRLASDGDSLTGLWFCGQKYDGIFLTPDAILDPYVPVFRLTADWLDAYFKGRAPQAMDIPINPQGSVFQQRVWDELRRIPYGTSVTYGDIARRIHSAGRAVGAAVGHNPIAIIIPCHRVVGVNGKMVGYAGGLSRKQRLLALERCVA